ncbi:hypothetical protein H0G77_08115 [[Pasteurella] aerogenes]|nr:hypothetical protein [[Pasteurella] aerogenes]
MAESQDFGAMAARLSEALQNIALPVRAHPLSGYWLLSATDGEKRAKTVSFQTASIESADLAVRLKKMAQKFESPLKWLRLEWVSTSQETTWQALQQEFKKYKRNYFRSGIAFEGKKEPWLLCSEMELMPMPVCIKAWMWRWRRSMRKTCRPISKPVTAAARCLILPTA